jgi:signal transduction histidine kinase
MIEKGRGQIWEQDLPELLEELPDIVFSIDALGRFTFLAHKSAHFLLNPLPFLHGKALWECTAPEDVERAKSILNARANSLFDEEIAITDELGNVRRFRLRCRLDVTDSGKVLGGKGLMLECKSSSARDHDLGRLKSQLAESRKTIDELTAHVAQGEKYRAVATHIAEAAHELKQPLTVIGGFARRMANKLGDWEKLDPGTQPECFTIITKELKRLEDMLNGLLTIGKRDVLHMEHVNPDAMIEEILNIHTEILRDKGLKVDFDSGMAESEVEVDPHLFEHVVRNLLTNAVEASCEGGTIRIETAVVSVTPEGSAKEAAEEATHFELKIMNGGEPIRSDLLEEIFKPFYTTKPGGNGIGLTLSRHIVEEHQGSIAVTSDWGGTIFSVRIPLGLSESTSKSCVGVD